MMLSKFPTSATISTVIEEETIVYHSSDLLNWHGSYSAGPSIRVGGWTGGLHTVHIVYFSLVNELRLKKNLKCYAESFPSMTYTTTVFYK